MAKPTDDSGVFLDQLIASIQTHLPTIQGMYLTTSLYPPLLTPGPGAVPFVGYTIPPASKSVGGGNNDIPSTPEEKTIEQKHVEEAIKLSPEQEAIADEASDMGYDVNESTAAGLSGERLSSPASRNNDGNNTPQNSEDDSAASNASNIQLTGRANYTQFRKGVSDDVVGNSTLVEKKYVAETACWFWRTRKLNEAAIDDSIGTLKTITKRINGGYNGFEDRKQKFCGYWKKLKENPNLYS